ncbi:MAG: hypothetical protein HYX92_03455 [Chloroflexi bacterium]|nr:hypothetical protein [Chloroflexota bacterium]
MPDLAIAEYPGAIQLDTDAQIKEKVDKVVLDRIIEGLTKPTGSAGAMSAVNKLEEIVFAGTFEEINSFFLQKGWTDRLPIVPPTPEKVEQFLKHTDLSPDEGVATLPQANLLATPRNIAVNAVMAGCSPEHMPLLIAAVEAIGDSDFALMNLGSTGCKTPWLLVNGPIVKRLGIEYGVATRSRGPNPVIGRALGLIVNNIAGFVPGETAMGCWGYYLPFVFAEDEDACDDIGWEPYHVEHGFSRNTSTVTARTTIGWGGHGRPTSEGSPGGSGTAESLLQLARVHHQRQVTPEHSVRFGPRNNVAVLMTPPYAKALANAGYSKRDVVQWLWQNARVTVREENAILQNFTGVGLSVHDFVEEGMLPKWFDVAPDDTIPLLASPDMLDVVVCGDKHRDKMMTLFCNYNRAVTREVKLPVGWDSLLRERES